MIKETIKNRAILVTTRIRFSPKTQSLKEKAIDKMVEQILYTKENEYGMNITEIQENSGLKDCYYSLNIDLIEKSLDRLIKENRIIKTINNGEKYFRLTRKSRNNLEQILLQAERNFNFVLDKLFSNTTLDKEKYSEPFFKSLCIIFSNLGEENVNLLTGELEQEKISGGIFNSAIKEIEKEFPWIDINIFKNILFTFFYDNDRQYNEIKWNMAQSYYISKSLGLENSKDILSEHIFRDSSFYLDTNIIIAALEPLDRNYKGFLTFNKACKKIGIDLNVCEITINELENLIASQYDLMKNVMPSINEELYDKINSSIFKIYRNRLKKNKDLKLEDFLNTYNNPAKKLKNKYNVNIIRDRWFDKKLHEVKTQQVAQKIQHEYLLIKGNKKNWNAAIHDALILLWIENLRESNNKNIWFATLDTTLPAVKIKEENNNNLSITLCALLQWIAPFILSKKEEKEFPTIFAEMIKNRLLPQEQFFDLKDFLIFKNLEIDCKSLPVEDVERCLELIKVKAPNLNPNKPNDLIKLSYQIERFFLDIGRKYKSNEEQLKEKLSKSEQEKDRILNEYEKLKELNTKKELKQSAKTRLLIIILIQIVITVSTIILIYIYGYGENLFQKISNHWVYLAGTFAFFFIGGYFILGKERLKSLGWKFERLFKAK